MPVMSAVHRRPPDRRPLKSQVAARHKKVFNNLWAREGTMRQESMIAYRHAQGMPEVKKEEKGYKLYHDINPQLGTHSTAICLSLPYIVMQTIAPQAISIQRYNAASVRPLRISWLCSSWMTNLSAHFSAIRRSKNSSKLSGTSATCKTRLPSLSGPGY